jgi:hypothetical protein
MLLVSAVDVVSRATFDAMLQLYAEPGASRDARRAIWVRPFGGPPRMSCVAMLRPGAGARPSAAGARYADDSMRSNRT